MAMTGNPEPRCFTAARLTRSASAMSGIFIFICNNMVLPLGIGETAKKEEPWPLLSAVAKRMCTRGIRG